MDKTKIRIGICGYGNLGKGVQKAIAKSDDMELKVIFTRRNPAEVTEVALTKVVSVNEAMDWEDELDVVIMCGGSKEDLPKQVPMFARLFSTVDSFDTHAKIPGYLAAVDKKAKKGGNVAICSTGWDPGLFSLIREVLQAIFPCAKIYTFWGEGVSQGHSDAIRRIAGVKDAVQYTIPIKEAIERVRNGETPEFSKREMHLRRCFVVAEERADEEKIKNDIITMPDYFVDYITEVKFVSEEELKEFHSGMPHGGLVICTTETSPGVKQKVEFVLDLASNPEFTGSVLTAYARAAYRMKQQGQSGAVTMLDVPPIMISPQEREEVIRTLL